VKYNNQIYVRHVGCENVHFIQQTKSRSTQGRGFSGKAIDFGFHNMCSTSEFLSE